MHRIQCLGRLMACVRPELDQLIDELVAPVAVHASLGGEEVDCCRSDKRH